MLPKLLPGEEDVRLDTIELVLVKARVFSTITPIVVSSIEKLCLENLAAVRANPLQYVRNLELCESVDTAETELKSLVNCILVETTPQHQNVDWLIQLATRLKKQNTTLLLGGLPNTIAALPSGTQLGLIGEVELVGYCEQQINNVLAASAQAGDAPVLFSLRPPSFDSVALNALLVRINQLSNTTFLIAGGVVQNLEFCSTVLSNSNALIVLDPKGYACDSEFEDQAMANQIWAVMQANPHRFVLGLDFTFAIQLRRFGGDGYFVAVQSFLHKLQKLGVSSEVIRQVARDNALRVLCYRCPPVQVAPPERQKWTCHTCHTSKLEGDEFFESHGKRFCSAKCMREFRLLNTYGKSENENGFTKPRNSNNNTASWGVSL